MIKEGLDGDLYISNLKFFPDIIMKTILFLTKAALRIKLTI
jgi:hypothetical protein